MSFTHRMSSTFSRPGWSDQQIVDKVGTGEATVDEVITAGGTNVQVNVAIAYPTLKSLYIVSSQAATLKTNSSSAPDNTITLIAAQPYWWHDTIGTANPLTVNVTKIYVTNGSGTSDATLKLVALVDATP